MHDDHALPERRRFIRALIGAPLVLAAGSKLGWTDLARAAEVAARRPAVSLTPECGDDDEPTPSETAGPFFKTHSPLRTSLVETGLAGTRIRIDGRVFSRGCKPLAGALLDFWQADDSGHYDNSGFRLRGHQLTDADGRYRLDTIVPGVYPGRTRHIHVRVQAEGSPILTTQLYFPGEAMNRRDGLFRPDLLVRIGERAATRQARFHFLLDVS